MKRKINILLITVLLTAGVMELPAKKIELYGYSNFLLSYYNPAKGKENYTFSQNRTNILVKSEFFKRWDFFVNVEFTGTFKVRSKPSYSVDSKGVKTLTQETETTGMLELEEAWTGYTASEKFKIRVGQFHASFGTFNAIQDMAPTYISVRPPLIYDDKVREDNPVSIIPDKSNLEISGIFRRKNFALEYALYAGSGAGGKPAGFKMDTDVSVGARLLLNFDENIKLGFSTYFDKAYYDDYLIETFLKDGKPSKEPMDFSEKRASFSSDVDITFGRFNVNAEYIMNKNNNNGLGKFDRTFFYVNINAEIVRKLRIYVELDSFEDNSPAKGIRTWYGKGLNKFIGGINYKPNWVTAIKMEVEHNYFRGKDWDDWRFLASLSVIF